MLYVDGITNVRDFGGFRTTDGKIVRQGLIYRTSELNGHLTVSEAGKKTLIEELNIRTDLDLRGKNKEPYLFPVLDERQVTWIQFPLEAYETIFTDAQKELYRQSFSLLTDQKRYPFIVHCWAGIDRTGTWLYILGGMLGMNGNDLALDYEMSSFAKYGTRTRNSEYFVGFLNRLHQYGSDTQDACTAFLRDCGLSGDDLARIREILLET